MLKNLIILPDGTEIFSGNARDNAIISCKYTQCVNDSTELSIGSCCCNELEIKLFAKDVTIVANDEIQYYKVDDSGARTKMGVFFCEKPTVTGTGTYKFIAYDNVSKLDKDLTEWLSGLTGWSYTVATFAGMVCAQCGVTLSLSEALPNQDYQIREFSGSGVTGRMIIQWLGQIACRFVRANADGEIEFAWYADRGAEITTNGDLRFFGGSLSYEDFQVAEVQKVQIQASDEDNGTVYPDGNEEELNTYKITGNYLLTAETGDELKPVAQAIFEQLQGVTYTPCKVSIQATTAINAGDIVHITDRNGVTITTYVMSKTNSGQKDTLECTGSYKRSSSTATNNVTLKALYGKVLNLTKTADGLRIQNADTEGKVAELELNVDNIKLGVSEATSKAEAAQASADATAKDLNDYAETVSANLTDLQNQIDGAIETWFYDYAPTTKNAPASAWTTTEDKNKHLGDLFYIVDNEDLGGQIYRWALVSGTYSWVLVEDTEVAKALETASRAQDTADGKRRVFVSQPTPPYDIGDLWTDGADLRVCKTARTTGSYTASDWQLATEYIDESVAQAKADAAESAAKSYASAQIKVASDSILQEVKGTYTTKTDFSKAVVSVQEEYYRSVSSATTVGGEWSTSEPTWAEGIYVWNRRLVTYGDGSTGYEPSERGVCVTGNTGVQGTTGKGVKSSSVTYQASTSGTTVPTGTWSTSIPSVSAGSYLWTRTIITYTDSTTSTSYSVGMMGATGAKGDTGATGATGAAGRGIKSTATTYQAGASGTTAPTGTWTTSVPATSASAPYLWTRTITTYTDGTTSTAYSVGSTPEGIVVGGRNLQLGSQYWDDTAWLSKMGVTIDGSVCAMAQADYPKCSPIAVEIGGTYTISFDIRADVSAEKSPTYGLCLLDFFDDSYTRVVYKWIDGTLTSDWLRVSKTFTVPNNPNIKYLSVGLRNTDSIKSVYFRKLKLEKGNKATDWTPAPEDVDAEINATNERIDGAIETITETQTDLKVLQDQTDERWAVTATKEEVETTVTEAVDSVHVGGRNLLLDTNSITPRLAMDRKDGAYTVSHEEMLGVDGALIDIKEVSTGWSLIKYQSKYILLDKLQPDCNYVFSCDIWASVDLSKTNISIKLSSSTNPLTNSAYIPSIQAETWTHVSVPLKTVTDFPTVGDQVLYWAVFNQICQIKICNLKLEKGNKATDWTPAPEDIDAEIDDLTTELSATNTRVENAETQISATQKEVNLRATVDYVDTTVKEVTDGLVEKSTFDEYQRSAEAELSVMADKVGISVSEQLRQEIKAGDDEILNLYNELRMNYDFTADGQYIGKKDSDTLMRLVNDMMQILVAGVAATTVDRNGLTASQANVKTLHIGNYTLTASDDGKLTLT